MNQKDKRESAHVKVDASQFNSPLLHNVIDHIFDLEEENEKLNAELRRVAPELAALGFEGYTYLNEPSQSSAQERCVSEAS
jgi:uncharacterized protein (UPF0335 family)